MFAYTHYTHKLLYAPGLLAWRSTTMTQHKGLALGDYPIHNLREPNKQVTVRDLTDMGACKFGGIFFVYIIH